MRSSDRPRQSAGSEVADTVDETSDGFGPQHARLRAVLLLRRHPPGVHDAPSEDHLLDGDDLETPHTEIAQHLIEPQRRGIVGMTKNDAGGHLSLSLRSLSSFAA